MDDVYEQNLGQ